MSTITLQHIPVYQIRDSILRDAFRVLKPGGTLSIQMGYGDSIYDPRGNQLTTYLEDNWNASGTNSDADVQVLDASELASHLSNLGLADLEITVRPSFSDIRHSHWIYAVGKKPVTA